jgi:hypothetical protein
MITDAQIDAAIDSIEVEALLRLIVRAILGLRNEAQHEARP